MSSYKVQRFTLIEDGKIEQDYFDVINDKPGMVLEDLTFDELNELAQELTKAVATIKAGSNQQFSTSNKEYK